MGSCTTNFVALSEFGQHLIDTDTSAHCGGPTICYDVDAIEAGHLNEESMLDCTEC